MKSIFTKSRKLLAALGTEKTSRESVRTGSDAVSEPMAATMRSGGQSVRTGSALVPIDTLSWHAAEEHAVALLDWLQGPGGRVGDVPAGELMRLHGEVCAELFWQQLGWIPVAKAFRKLINDPVKRYASCRSRRVVVYRIPRRGAQLTLVTEERPHQANVVRGEVGKQGK